MTIFYKISTIIILLHILLCDNVYSLTECIEKDTNKKVYTNSSCPNGFVSKYGNSNSTDKNQINKSANYSAENQRIMKVANDCFERCGQHCYLNDGTIDTVCIGGCRGKIAFLYGSSMGGGNSISDCPY